MNIYPKSWGHFSAVSMARGLTFRLSIRKQHGGSIVEPAQREKGARLGRSTCLLLPHNGALVSLP